MGKTGKRNIAAWMALLLALLLILPAPGVLAAQTPASSGTVSEVESALEESSSHAEEESTSTETPEPSSEPSEEGSQTPSEETSSSQLSEESQLEEPSQPVEGESLEETQEEPFGANALLKVGGHDAYMSGEEGALFFPDRAMTRAEMAQVLYNLLASYPTVSENYFSDVSTGAWYAKAVNTLVYLDVLSGYEDGTYQPNNQVTRAEFVTAVCKCFGLTSGASNSFSDVGSHWAVGYINAAVGKGWISGFEDNTFRPDANITRAQVTPILNKALERTGDGFASDAGTQEFVDVPSGHWAYEHIAEAADPVSAPVEVGCIVQVTADGGLNLRSSPDSSQSGNIIGGVPKGSQLTVLKVESNGWLQVRTGSGLVGYVSGEYVTVVSGPSEDPEEPEDPDPSGFQVGQQVKVTADNGLNLRSGPGTTYDAVTTLATGALLTITSIESNGWLGVKTQGGVTGYVHPDYVVVYDGGNEDPGVASGAKLSSSSLSLAQYQSVRLDGSVSENISAMKWQSSDPSVAYVAYTIPYGSTTQMAMIYGAKPGTATITFTDGQNTSATCTVTVQSPQAVRFAYAGGNIVGLGQTFNLTAITDTGKAAVHFEITSGPATGGWTTQTYTTESHVSSYGLPTNTVRVFTYPVAFQAAGTYTIRATSSTSSGGSMSSDSYEFTVQVTSSAVSSTTATNDTRRASGEIIKILANFEGFLPEIEDDKLAPGNPTVGHGYVVGKHIPFYNNLTSGEAYAHLVSTVNKGSYASAVESFRQRYNIKMSQAQFDALTSFVYNCGPGTLSENYGFCRAILNAVDPTGISESSPVTGVLNVSDGILYQSASTSKKVGTVALNTKVTVDSYQAARTSTQQEVWYHVTTSDGKVGWMPAGYVQLQDGRAHDLSWADSTVVANNILQWNSANGVVYPGLVYRRLAECKVFFFGNYGEANNGLGTWYINTYHFNFPDNIQQYNSDNK